MSTIFLPVRPIDGMSSKQRADALDAEVWRLVRPAFLHRENDGTIYYFGRIDHPETGQTAIMSEPDVQVEIHHDVDLTDMLALLPEVPQVEKDMLVMFVDANRGGTIPFGQLIPSTSEQLTEEEAKALGWLPDPIEPE